MRHLLGLEDLSGDQITGILDLAAQMKAVNARRIKKLPTLRGVTVLTLFVEPSTRTRMSFELAAKRLSADVMSFSAATSSLSKGETLIDTAKNLEAMGPDLIVIRHGAAGAPRLLTQHVGCGVVSGGDGFHEHPTQGLLDAFTLREKLGSLAGRKIAIVGDILHSRVARSNIWGLGKLGADVHVAGPATMLPAGIEDMGCTAHARVEPALEGADAVMMLRVQRERMDGGFFPSAHEFHRFFGLDEERLKLCKPGAPVLHPGPMNRGVEIAPEVADGPQSVILEQVENGVAVRMAVLYLVAATHGLDGRVD
ncbi:MAG: aspartate carbamoyltransferase catalytic subunit [Myxococcales bacterium]|nr:aspartate carbamoyltransferase catalytic subunit [Myxococcales bacterium]